MNNKCTPIKKNDTNDLYMYEIIVRDIDIVIFYIQSWNLIYYANIDDKVFIEFKN